jgi:hypothetical protein
VRERDHNDVDVLIVIFMSHGGISENDIEFVSLYDQYMCTAQLWEPFTGDKCPTVEGKPKLFFIQVKETPVINDGLFRRCSAVNHH